MTGKSLVWEPTKNFRNRGLKFSQHIWIFSLWTVTPFVSNCGVLCGLILMEGRGCSLALCGGHRVSFSLEPAQPPECHPALCSQEELGSCWPEPLRGDCQPLDLSWPPWLDPGTVFAALGFILSLALLIRPVFSILLGRLTDFTRPDTSNKLSSLKLLSLCFDDLSARGLVLNSQHVLLFSWWQKEPLRGLWWPHESYSFSRS